jgi:Protein of unknown function (DUF3606)
MDATARKLSTWEPTQVNVSNPQELNGWCNKWSVTPERLKAVVAKVGTSAMEVEKALGKRLTQNDFGMAPSQ